MYDFTMKNKITSMNEKNKANRNLHPRKMLNNISLKKKLILVQLCCVFFPLVLTDAFLIFRIIQTERKTNQIKIENIAESISYSILNYFEYPINLMDNIYSNKYINEFICTDHENPFEYYVNKLNLMKDSLYEAVLGKHNFNTVVYADNPSIVNGGLFKNVDFVRNSFWYTKLMAPDKNFVVFEEYKFSNFQSKRYISIAKRMDYYSKGSGTGAVRIDLDYAGINQNIQNAKYETDVYVCSSGKILFSNIAECGMHLPFEMLDPDVREKSVLRHELNVYGNDWDIYIMPISSNAFDAIRNNIFQLSIMFSLNILLPFIFVFFIKENFIKRLGDFERAVLNGRNKGRLECLENVTGSDEISTLMFSYNALVKRMNELIETEYKNKLREQEMNIAKQKAELLALHSQINPHFLFNALESIRMHSVLKKEFETADMVEKLALMQRQNVEWGNDSVRIEKEILFIEAYLELQKYRFGNKLNYKIEVEESCNRFRVPKLSLVTFVENACVHGVEEKSSSVWIFIHVCIEKDNLVIEIEDTGRGMNIFQREKLQREVDSVNIQMLQEKQKGVGLLNAALRLNIFYEEQVKILIESEEGSGTIVTLSVPRQVAELMQLL